MTMSARDPLLYPKLRWPLEVRQQDFDGKNIIVLSCPLGIADKPLGLLAAVGPILGCFEGKLSIDEIAEKFKQYGLSSATVAELARLVDEYCFLDSPRFQDLDRNVRMQFSNAEVRKPALAGLSYPNTANDLSSHLDQFLAHGNGLTLVEQLKDKKLLGLVSPHIDYHRGGVCYGIAWNALKKHDHDLYLILGTSHQYSSLMFHLTRKDFETPLGTLHCDREFVDKLATRYGTVRAFTDEFLHRREHSLELQTPFLRHLKSESKIVPILVGGFHHMLRSGKLPSEFDEYENFAGGLSECLREIIAEGRRICLIAGVDMAHVGPQFGDKEALTKDFMTEVEKRDREYLSAIETHDKHKLFLHVEEDLDRRRICGFPTMYMILDVLERIGIRYHAQTFDYRQAVDYSGGCAVTFAGMGLYQV